MNPKPTLRAFDGTHQVQFLKELAQRVSYAGNPAHKRNPGDFGLTPPSAPRQGATLCDSIEVFSRAVAEEMLRNGVEAGLISEAEVNGLPKNIWAVAGCGTPVEAILENREAGTYHGYPMLGDEPMRDEVLKRWRNHFNGG